MIRLPRTLHIEGSRLPQGRTDPEAVQFSALAGKFLYMEEKVDGTGVVIFFDNELTPRIWHRGSPATSKEFNKLHDWVNVHQDNLFDLLEDRYLLFGEWMLRKHHIYYDRLPSYFLESDIYDQKTGTFLSTMAREDLLRPHDYIRSVPVLAALKPTKLSQVTAMIKRPLYQSDMWRAHLWHKCEMYDWDLEKVLKETDQSELAEGLYIKHEDEQKVIGRYKYVRYEFVEGIINSGTHLIDREPIHNSLAGEVS
jgi:hypothetical protein